MLVKSNYPNYYKDSDEMGSSMLVNSWHTAFEDIPVEVMIKVFQKHLVTQDYPPTVKKLRESALQIVSPVSQISGEVAWDIAAKTAGRIGRYNKPAGMEELRRKNLTIAKTVEAIGWETICNAPLEGGFVKRDFLAYYNEVDSPEREQNLIPDSMWKKIQQMQEQNKMIESSKVNDLPEM